MRGNHLLESLRGCLPDFIANRPACSSAAAQSLAALDGVRLSLLLEWPLTEVISEVHGNLPLLNRLPSSVDN